MMWFFESFDIVDEVKVARTLHVFDNFEQAGIVRQDLMQFHDCTPTEQVPGCEVSIQLETVNYHFYGRVVP